jgi:geranylgeranyl transferase type-2 subunit alpha
MHGQKRSEYKSRLLNPEAASKLATKAQQWNALSNELLSQRRRLLSPSDADVKPPSPKMLLTLTEKMLTVNPDPSHLWNIRREMLLYLMEKESSQFDVQPELSLTAHCLQRNPKAYSSWFHRKWSIAYMLSSCEASDDQSSIILQSELDLCAQFLMLDERNFHCWNYRRYVVAVLGSRTAREPAEHNYNGAWSSWMDLLGEDGTSNEILMGAQIALDSTTSKNLTSSFSKEKLNDLIVSEWNFTSSKIQDNFSNGSAFHYRSKLISFVLESRLASDDDTQDNAAGLMRKQEEILSIAREEWEEILLNAIFTEPDDQTPWWYHRFIVAWAKPTLDLKDTLGDSYNELVDNYESLLYEMADSLRELLEVEKENGLEEDSAKRDESKGAKCKWAYLGLHLVLFSLIKLQRDDTVELLDEAQECLDALNAIDPCRRERYKMLAAELSA